MAAIIESKKVQVSTSSKQLFDFAADLNNFEKLLPQDKIKNFVSDGESCSFEISGMATLGLRVVSKESPNKISLKSEKSPFPFTLDIFISEDSNGNCSAHQVSNVDVNPFMKAMVERPLKNLFDYIADRLVAEFA